MRLPLIALALVAPLAGCAESTDPRPAEFEYIVTAILSPSCGTAACHSSQARREDVALDTIEAARETFDSRPFAIPFEPESSELPFLLRTDDRELRMPVDSPMPEADIVLIDQWILAGAVR